MPNVLLNRYDPDTDLPSLEGKVIFVTGGWSALLRLLLLAKPSQQAPLELAEPP